MTCRLILCADDFAYSRAISETIVELAAAKKINATSCMTVCPGWEADSKLLGSLSPGTQVGLHLVLTGERPLTTMPRFAPKGVMPDHDPLMVGAMKRVLPSDEIATEIREQFRRFIDVMGHPPDFVDGHQHSHVLPRIRSMVLEQTSIYAPNAWIRDCYDRLPAIAARPYRLKAIGSALHSAGLRRAASRYGLKCNSGFSGHYDFQSNYSDLFPAFLAKPGKTHLIMCHPGAGAAPGDAIAGARVREADALRKLPIADMAQRHGLEFAA